MSLEEDLSNEVRATFKAAWNEQLSEVVPDPEDLTLNANHGKKLAAATVLYADIDESTKLVQTYQWWFAAEIYKAYLRCASSIIKSEGGVITAYDGDRVMAIFLGDAKNTSAVRAALKINRAVSLVIQPLIKQCYPTDTFTLRHVVGIDTSEIRAARIGVRGDNDLVWVGRAANYAAKLCVLSEAPIWITGDVRNNIHESVVKSASGIDMWEQRQWTPMNNMTIYRTYHHWSEL
jgi:class 3 adenylate cyclase